MPFVKGQSGNPGGRSKELKEIQEAARVHAPAALRTLAHIAAKGKTEPARVKAAEALLDRGYGKPSQSHELGGLGGKPIEFHDVTDEARARALAALMARTKTKEPG